MHLALLGADVIRFDPIGGGIDYSRWPLAESGTSIYWTSLNKGKRSIQLDLRSAEGRELAQELITAPGADRGVFLTNFPARGWLDYDDLKARRDDLIMMAITGSPDGTTAVDYTVNAAVGYPTATGPVGDPVNHVLPAWDVICGQQAALGIVTAERHRLRTGEGQLITLALSDVAMSTVANLGHVAEAQVLGQQRPRIGNALYGAFGRDFVTSDGERYIVIAISPKQWKSMQVAMGIEGDVRALADRLDTDFADEGARFEHREALFSLVQDWSGSRTLAEIGDSLDDHGCCWGRYQDFLTMVSDDTRCSTENPMFHEVDQPGVGTVLSADTPLRFGAGPAASVPIAPKLGEHTDEILAEVLSLSAPEIGRLHDRGLIAGPA